MNLVRSTYPKVWELGCLSIQRLGTASVGTRRVEVVQSLKEVAGGQVLRPKNADVLDCKNVSSMVAQTVSGTAVKVVAPSRRWCVP